MIVTNDIIYSFINCPYKAYLKSRQQSGFTSDYQILYNKLKQTQISNFKKKLSEDGKILFTDISYTNPFQKKCAAFNVKFLNENIDIVFDGIEFLEEKAIIPIFITPFEKVTTLDKLFIALQVAFIQTKFSLPVERCKIISGHNLKETKFRISSFSKAVKKINNDLAKSLLNSNAPTFFKNPHCQICEFKSNCLEKLIERDDLSLLAGLKAKEILKRNNRGIFSVKQLSYLFRPKKMPYSKRAFLPELKALAIREDKTLIQDFPSLKEVETEVFVDFEGIPDKNSNYLIGLIIKTNNTENEYSFWANNKEDEKKIFIQLIDLIRPLKSFIIYHYGSYEIKVLKSISKILSSEYQDYLQVLTDNSFNLLNVFTHSIYPPTYSNSLKEIARLLKFDWTDTEASGLQSTIWRYNWEVNQDEKLKEKLIRYNIEDCRALIIIVNWIATISERTQDKKDNHFTKTKDIKIDSYHKWGNTKFELPVFQKINEFSHFDYQQKRIFIKSNPKLRKTRAKKPFAINKIDKVVHLFPKMCPKCDQSSENFDLIRKGRLLSIDIKFTKNGIKRWIVEYQGGGYRCSICRHIFSPQSLKRGPHYEDNIVKWAMNHYIQYNVSVKKISEMIMDSFNLHVPPSSITEFKPRLSAMYKETYEEIKMLVTKGILLHIDETKASIKDVPSGYVWVFTNMDSVFYIFKQNRVADFLKDLLIDFKGVLVSDFYSGYDAIDCSQQKCLVHLMRDLNNDLLHNYLNDDFKHIVFTFGQLLSKIMETVNKYGLKKRNLNKHKRDVYNTPLN